MSCSLPWDLRPLVTVASNSIPRTFRIVYAWWSAGLGKLSDVVSAADGRKGMRGEVDGCSHQQVSRCLPARATGSSGILGRGGAGDRLVLACEMVFDGGAGFYGRWFVGAAQHLLQRGRSSRRRRPRRPGRADLRQPGHRREARATAIASCATRWRARRRRWATSASARAIASLFTCRWCRKR